MPLNRSRIFTSIVASVVALAATVGAAPAAVAQTSEKMTPGASGAGAPVAEPLGDKLNRTGGVITPPSEDAPGPDVTVPAPEPGSTTPSNPNLPGGDKGIVPK